MAARSHCRSALVMNTAHLPLPHRTPLRVWLIALSGLASGMVVALFVN